MGTTFLTSGFSPLMVAKKHTFWGREISLQEAREQSKGAISAVSHQITAKVLSTLLGRGVRYQRINLELFHGDRIVCISLNFRAEETREFTKEEVEAAGFRCFLIDIIE